MNKHVKTPQIKSKVGAPIKLKTLKTTLITKEQSAITPDVNTNFLIILNLVKISIILVILKLD